LTFKTFDSDAVLRRNANSPKVRVIYLACPYTHPELSVREYRFAIATRGAAELIRRGHVVFSPITMTHPIDVLLAGRANTLGSDYWVAFDQAFMDMCAEMVILDVPDWEKSSGIAREIQYFNAQGKEVSLMRLEQLEAF
jgi:hypothetical protein